MRTLLTALVLGSGLVLPVAYAHATPQAAAVEQALLRQENSGPAGRVTRSVHCTPHGGTAYQCALRSVRSTTLDAHVVARDGGLETAWAPLHG